MIIETVILNCVICGKAPKEIIEDLKKIEGVINIEEDREVKAI